jgi:hypothetical protein
MVSFSAVAHVTCFLVGVAAMEDSLFCVIAGWINNVHSELIGGRSISGDAAGVLRHILGGLLDICAWESRSGLGFGFGVHWSMLPASYFPRDNLGCSIGVRFVVTAGTLSSNVRSSTGIGGSEYGILSSQICEFGFAIFAYVVLLFELPAVFAQVAPVVFHSTVSLLATHVTIFALISLGTVVRLDGK